MPYLHFSNFEMLLAVTHNISRRCTYTEPLGEMYEIRMPLTRLKIQYQVVYYLLLFFMHYLCELRTRDIEVLKFSRI